VLKYYFELGMSLREEKEDDGVLLQNLSPKFDTDS
jgi:hypothetical protein